ncbi:FK506-binding protein 2A [Ceratobasidium sp. 392]|nr:FK506-binding protein 2A [Ceratobasidium sp. 392]
MSFLTRTALRASPFAAVASSSTRPSYNALARRAYTMSSIKSETLVAPKDEHLRTQDGDVLSMHYTGTFQSNGSTFDSSRDRGAPFEFKLGAGQVIRGWDQGLQGMGVGERRKLTLPPAYAYGTCSHSTPKKRVLPFPCNNNSALMCYIRTLQAHVGFLPIPPNATLVFDVELLEIKNRKD